MITNHEKISIDRLCLYINQFKKEKDMKIKIPWQCYFNMLLLLLLLRTNKVKFTINYN